MSTEDNANNKERERQKLLEDIRKRAEEAELRRIEEEERKVSSATDGELEGGSPSDSMVEPGGLVVRDELKPQPIDEQRLIELREQFTIAVDRKQVERALSVFLELAEIIPGTLELTAFERKLRALQQDVEHGQTRVRVEPPVEYKEQPQKSAAATKKVTALLEKSISLYEQEKYDQALVTVEEALSIEEEHEDALDLRRKIQKARELADQIRVEEALRRSEEAATHPQKEDVATETREKGESIWGAAPVLHGDVEFGLPLETKEAPEPSRVPLAKMILEKASRIRIPVKALLVTLGAIGVLAIAYFVYERIQSVAGIPTHSISIFPASYNSSDSLGRVLSYALAAEMSSHLAVVPDLRVIAAHSSASAQLSQRDPADAARALNVRYYLRWDIESTPSLVKFDLSIRDTSTSDVLWTSHSESSLRELPGAVLEVVQSITEAIDLTFDAERHAFLASVPTRDPNAYLGYLRGRYMMNHPEEFKRTEVITAFQGALQADPSFAGARVALARNHLMDYESGNSASNHLDHASIQVREAVALKCCAPEAYTVLGLVEQFNSKYEKAMEYFEEATRVGPSDAEAHRRLSALNLIRGKPDDALRAAMQARDLDPLNADSHTQLALVYEYLLQFHPALESYTRGARFAPDEDQYVVSHLPEVLVSLQRHDNAEEILENEVARSRDDYVNYYRLGRVSQAAGRPISRWEEAFNRAKDLLRRHLQTSPNDALARTYLALVYTRLGRHKEAVVETDKALRVGQDRTAVLYNAARVFAIQKDNEKAMEFLGKAIDRRYDISAVLDMDFYNLRLDSNFLTSIAR